MDKNTRRILLVLALIGLAAPAMSATLEPRDLIVTERGIAATDLNYRYLWVIDRKSKTVEIALDVSKHPWSEAYDKKFQVLGEHVPPVVLLSRMDPRTQWQPPVEPGKKGWFWSFRPRLPYGGCSASDCPVLPPVSAPEGDWSRIVSLGKSATSGAFFDADRMVLASGSAGKDQAPRKTQTLKVEGNGLLAVGGSSNLEDRSDLIVGPDLGKAYLSFPLYVPVARNGAAGVLVSVAILEVSPLDNPPFLEQVGEISLGIGTIGSHGGSCCRDVHLGQRLYLVFEDLWVIDVAKQKLLAKKPLGLYGIAAQTSPDGSELYVLGAADNMVQVWDTEKLELITEIKLPTP